MSPPFGQSLFLVGRKNKFTEVRLPPPVVLPLVFPPGLTPPTSHPQPAAQQLRSVERRHSRRLSPVAPRPPGCRVPFSRAEFPLVADPQSPVWRWRLDLFHPCVVFPVSAAK
jgi:hypothetical protein